MINYLRWLAGILVLLFMIYPLSAASEKEIFHRNFWHPLYHGQRLDYCSHDHKYCGLELATKYCQMMGYGRADQAIKDNNIGLTNYLLTTYGCQGWQCSGFKTIRCLGKMSHHPAAPYYYRDRHFVYPRFNNYRIDWCYDGKKDCGRRPAYSFCRRMGFLNVKDFKLEKCITATQAIGNQRLCFGPQCKAYKYIDCYR